VKRSYKDALEKIGCTKIFTATISGSATQRLGLDEALEYVREGDTLVVWKLSRLGRSLKHLIETITHLNTRNIGFKSITENIDTTTSGEKLIFHIFGALAEFERDIIRERTNAGLQAARARGRLGVRPKAKTLDTLKKVALAQALYVDKTNTIDEICKTLNISRATLYRYINVEKRKYHHGHP
jgi:DNA invertase Pin-like site-specific DNA recombinase